MKKNITLIIFITILIFCNSKKKDIEKNEIKAETFRTINFELVKPIKNSKAALILFGGYGEEPEDIEREFKILEIAKKNKISVILMNYSKKLWLEENEKQKLTELLQNIFIENKLPTNDIYFGGFSSGGNVALLISSFIIKNKEFKLEPKGVFIVDSPIDLVALYRSSEKNLTRNFSEISVQESTWIIETLGKQFGNPNKDISKYEKYSIYTSETSNIDNLKGLENIKIRLYTEPDTLWWKENRKADYDQMNAYYIKKFFETLKKSGFSKVEYIPTKNKGYRANGDRHPHSWSIVDKDGLIKWIME